MGCHKEAVKENGLIQCGGGPSEPQLSSRGDCAIIDIRAWQEKESETEEVAGKAELLLSGLIMEDRMSSVGKKLFYHRTPYDHEATEELFFQAMRENVQFHLEHNGAYAELMNGQGFQLAQLQGSQDLYRLPPLPTLLLKRRPLHTIPAEKQHMRSTTSGTSGNPVTVGFDKRAMWLGFGMLKRLLLFHKLPSLRPSNVLVLGYQPSRHNHMGAVRTAYSATCLTPAWHKAYALVDTGTDYRRDEAGVQEALLRYSRSKAPVRIFGFPSYLYFLLLRMEQDHVQLTLPKGSMIMLGGGWKQFSAQRVEKAALYRMAETHLGIPETQFREFFGVVEHNVPYIDCPNHHFHVPVYGRVLIRDIDTLAPVQAGQPGLLNLMTPLLRSMPLASVLTDDIAVLHPGEACGCGNTAPYFEILGRAGLADIKTCTVDADARLGGSG